jgi:hypothetical protein
MDTILIHNERPGILDLSGVQDVNGLPVVLQAKGSPGDTRECPYEAGSHPHVESVARVGWVTITEPVPEIVPVDEVVPGLAPLPAFPSPKPDMEYVPVKNENGEIVSVTETPLPVVEVVPEPVAPPPVVHAPEVRRAKRR